MCVFSSAWAASVDGERERGGVGSRPGESGALDVGAVLVDLVVAVLRVHDEHAAHAESVVVVQNDLTPTGTGTLTFF